MIDLEITVEDSIELEITPGGNEITIFNSFHHTETDVDLEASTNYKIDNPFAGSVKSRMAIVKNSSGQELNISKTYNSDGDVILNAGVALNNLTVEIFGA